MVNDLADYTHKQLTEVEDSASSFGPGGAQQTRFASADLEARDTGVTHHRFAPGHRQGFAHRHDEAEEIYVVLAGSGRIKLDDEIVELEPLDAIRVAAPVLRAFEAGPDGLEVLAFGPHHENDGEVVQGWWS
jgi:mannose-6-phosphate isomerase-like protein (cupin superfamily)